MVGDVRTLSKSFERYLRATNRSARTVETYLEAVEQFARFLDRQELPFRVDRIRREHVRAYMEAVLARWKPSTASGPCSSSSSTWSTRGNSMPAPWPTWPRPRYPSSPCPCWPRMT